MPNKKKVSFWVNLRILQKWDERAHSMGISRTALIHNAMKVYELFIKNQLNGDEKESIREQLTQIKILLEGYKTHIELLDHEDNKVVDSFAQKDINELPDYEIISEKIINLLKVWGALPESTISAHLQYPGWIIWSILKKLAAENVVKVHNGEWSLK